LAAENRRDLAAETLERDWDKAAVQLAALRDQEELDRRTVAEAEELARMVYSSYKAGRSTFLEVQTYSLTALEAKVQAAQTRAQILIQLSTLAELAKQG
jgi:outer membrane protein TolC